METLLNLDELGVRLATLDRTMMLLAKRRMELAVQVGRFKREGNLPIFRAKVENDRIIDIVEYAEKIGLNQHFAAGLLYDLINESCKQQMIQLQSPETGKEPETDEEWYQRLKKRLLELTERTCRTYDTEYASEHYGTHAYLVHEHELMIAEIEKLAPEARGLALDIGCATGRVAFSLAPHFSQVIGYDLSQHMITTAVDFAGQRKDIEESSVVSEQRDVEDEGIPLPNNSVSFVVMNLGTASDIRDFSTLWTEIKRVLVPGGRFFFSFYNAEALLYRWDILPWPSSLTAHVNVLKHCLDVEVGSEIFSVYARPYKTDEMDTLLGQEGITFGTLTYPTVSSILPHDLFRDQPTIHASVTAMDKKLQTEKLGAYIIATGSKN